MNEWTEDQLRAYVESKYEDPAELHEVWYKIQTWLNRGDGAAVYENHDLGHPQLGEPRIVSWGSEAAAFDAATEPGQLPEILPDWPGQINWRYALVAACRREPAETVPVDVDLSPAKPGPDWVWPDEK